MSRISFVGLGQMGSGMAAALAKSGADLTVYNRTPEKTAPLAALNAKVVPALADAVRGAAVVITMLSDDNAVLSLFDDEIIALFDPSAVHVSMTTVSPACARELAARHARGGSGFLSCPVFGRPDAAAAGALRLCISGPADLRERVGPLLRPLGELWDFGDDPAASPTVKLAGNFMLATTIELLGEAYSFVEKNGVAPEAFYSLMTSTLFAAPAFKNYGRLILDQGYDTAGFKCALGAKDVFLLKETAKASRVPLPLASVVEDRMLRALARGWAEKDWTVVTHGQREDAGLA
jgi:3-hydroxyisobutyrate dehydrogenase-like beta-hydroxyacid dehydrogenase